MRLAIALLLSGVAVCFLLLGLLLIVWGFEHWLRDQIGTVAALVLTGGILLLMSGGIGWIASRRIR